MVDMQIKTVFPGVYSVDGLLATKNLVIGKKVYGERLIVAGEFEFRIWDLFRSKLAGAIGKGLQEMPIKPGKSVLYLGASTGTTVSHVSDIVSCEGRDGGVIAVEFAQRSMRDLLTSMNSRENVVPVMGDAGKPAEYKEIVDEVCGGNVNVVYQDVAQPDQAAILLKNADMFLKKGGFAMLCIKSQSIDVTARPSDTYRKTISMLEDGGFETLQTIELAPYDKDHLFWVGRKK